MKLRATVIGVILVMASSGLSKEPVRHPICIITLQTNPASSGWLLVCIDGSLYFEAVRKRHPDDKPMHWPFKSKDPCRRFELTSEVGSTTIKCIKCGESPDTYLRAVFSTDPPSVMLEQNAEKASTWKIRRGEHKEWYIESVDDTGKTAWLSKDEKVSTVIPMRDPNRVVDCRRAVVSYDAKPALKIEITNDER